MEFYCSFYLYLRPTQYFNINLRHRML